MGFFLGGLKKQLRAQIQDNVITSYSAALQAARKADHSLSPAPPSYARAAPALNYSPRTSHNPFVSPTTSHVSSNLISTLSIFSRGSSTPRNPRKFHHVSNENLQKYLAAGTCFRCGGKFGPMHRCPPKTLQVLIGDEEDEPDDDNGDFGDTTQPEETVTNSDPPTLQSFQLSELTSFGFDCPQTMKLFGRVGETRLLLMIDSGASHCFVAEKVARKLNWSIEPTSTFSVY